MMLSSIDCTCHIRQRHAGLIIMAMHYNRYGLRFLAMHQQNDHLAGAIVRAMMWAWAINLRQARGM